MSRAVSTAIDAAVFLVLVSAATLTLATAPPARPVDGDAADETAFVVATATTTVEYDPAGRTTAGDDPPRTAHGTLAGLLADAAFATATVDGRPLTPTGGGFERAVRAATRERLPARGVQVVATWRPVPGADVVGRTVVGPSPPSDADVSAATLTVGVPAGDTGTPNGTFEGLGTAVARAVVGGRFPPAERAATSVAGWDEGYSVERRYRHAAGVLDVGVAGPLRRGDRATANRRLAAALARRFAAALRGRHDDPSVAAATVAPDRVRVTVRRWSR